MCFEFGLGHLGTCPQVLTLRLLRIETNGETNQVRIATMAVFAFCSRLDVVVQPLFRQMLC